MAKRKWLPKIGRYSLDGSGWVTAITILALLVVMGVLPTLIVGIGGIAVSTAFLAVLVLLARQYGVIEG